MKLPRRLIALFAVGVCAALLVGPAGSAAADAPATPAGPVVTVAAAPDPAKAAIQRDHAAVLAAARARKVVPDPKATEPAGKLQLRGTSGNQPSRKGTILVTSDAYKGLIPTGHAAMVWSAKLVIESVANGVKWGVNDWQDSKREAFGTTVKSTTAAQDAKAADWAKAKIGKPYNLAYWNIDTRTKFYCSQLVWAAFKDKFTINLNTSEYSYWGVKSLCIKGKVCTLVPVRYNPVHPMELVRTPLVNVFWHWTK